MALTYEQSADLMKDGVFQGRIKVACLKYADYILNEPADTPGHSSRTKWASSTYTNPDYSAQQVQPPTVMDAAVQDQGSAIDDAGLQSAVEGVVNKMI